MSDTKCQCASCAEPKVGRWRVDYYDAAPGTAEVVPVLDVIGHEASDECACGPSQEALKRDDGSVGWLVKHHSLDGRERRE